MRNLLKKIRPIVFMMLLVLIIFSGGLLTYFMGTLGIAFPNSARIVETPLLISTLAPLEGAPLIRFGRIDPAIIDVLDYRPSIFGTGDLSVFDVQPIGIYIPRTGDTLFELADPTPFPTPLPFPTSPPLPLPSLADLPTLIPSSNSRNLAYGGDNCAPSGRPVQGVLTQRYHRYHSGIDIGIPLGTPIASTHSGTVTFAGWSDIGYGYLVIIQNGRFITYYAHNTSFNVEVGMQVGKGTIVAWSGSTGNSSGPHLHYETRINDIPVDPLTFDERGYPTC